MVRSLLPGPQINICLKAIYQRLLHDSYHCFLCRVQHHVTQPSSHVSLLHPSRRFPISACALDATKSLHASQIRSQSFVFRAPFIRIMVFKAVTVLLAALCSSLALIPQLTPGLFSFNLFRSPITFPCCDPALRQCATQSNTGELSPQPKLYVPTLNYRHVTSVFRNVRVFQIR